MGKVHVWTRQNNAVADLLLKEGRHIAKREFVMKNDDSALVRDCYEWLASALPKENKPADADYPIWLSFSCDAAMLPAPGSAMLELEIDEALIMHINIAKWGAINNFSYIPADSTDAKRHKKLVESLGISDAKAYMSRFYPELKKEIEDSWQRLFDDSIKLGNDFCYGLVWELKAEWIVNIERVIF